jgi:LPXTG-motif cell wall-anchored protein
LFGIVPLYERGERKDEWGMIAAALGLGLAGVFFAVRKRKMNAEA